MKFEVFTDAFEEFIGVDFFTMIFAWVNILILYLFLKKILFVPVKNMIDRRQKEVDTMYENAERSESEANALREQYDEKIAGAKEESEEILRDAVRRAQLREEEILRDADEKAARIRERAEEQVELEKKRAVNEIKDEVSVMAIDIAEAVIEREVDEREHREMIDEFIRTMGDDA